MRRETERAGPSRHAPGCTPPPGSGAVAVRRLAASLPGPLIAVVVAGTYLALVQYSFFLNDPARTGPSLWPAAGVTLAALLVLPVRRWGWVVGAVFAAELASNVAVHDYAVHPSLWWAAGNALQPVVAATLIGRHGGGTRITPVTNLLWFVALGVVVGPIVGATLASIGAVAADGVRWSVVWWKWLVGDGLGILIVTPVLLAPLQPRGRERSPGEAVLLAALVVVSTTMVFRNWDAYWDVVLPYLIIPLLMLVGLRFGVRAVALAGFVVAQGANLATALGYGPFALAGTGADTVTLLQIFLFIALLTGLVVAALVEDVASRAEVQRLLAHQAGHDALTGLPNRVSLMHELDRALSRSARTGRQVGVFFLDLDRFKVINDSLGHRSGDIVLSQIAQRLASVCRPDDTIARFGGDEFVVVCPELDAPDQAEVIAARLLATASEPVEHDGRRMTVGASVGIVLGEGDEVTAADLLRDGDTAMYRAKGEGGGRFQVFDRELRRRALDRWQLEVDLATALELGQMDLVYQPIVALDDGHMVCVEATLRWRHPSRGVLASPAFLTVAEESGLLRPLGHWVAGTAIRQLATWGDDDLSVSFNASAAQIDRRPGGRSMLDVVAEACGRSGVGGDRVWLELNESTLLPDESSVEELERLDRFGVCLVLDHFGAGYSSLTRLRGLPFDILKIDSSFVAEVARSPQDAAVVRSVIELGHALGMVVVAQGVEHERQAEVLAGLDCDLAQGWHFGGPDRAEQIARSLAERALQHHDR